MVAESIVNSSASQGINPSHTTRGQAQKSVSFQGPAELVGYSVPDETPGYEGHTLDDTTSPSRSDSACCRSEVPHHQTRKVEAAAKPQKQVRFSCMVQPKPAVTPGLLALRKLREGDGATAQRATKRVRFGCLQKKEQHTQEMYRGSEEEELAIHYWFLKASMLKRQMLGFCPMPQLVEEDEEDDGEETNYD